MSTLALRIFIMCVGITAGTFLALLLIDLLVSRMASEIGAASIGLAGALVTIASIGR